MNGVVDAITGLRLTGLSFGPVVQIVVNFAFHKDFI